MNHYSFSSHRVIICIFAAALALYAHIDEKNDITAMQLTIPTMEREVRTLQMENERLQYEIDRFESPIHLMELLRKPEFSHLKYPSLEEIVILSKEKDKEGWESE